jgi:magnesium-transporting ATPase (P-type)
MGVLVKDQQQDRNMLYVKGAPESIIERATRVQLQSGEIVEMTP